MIQPQRGRDRSFVRFTGLIVASSVLAIAIACGQHSGTTAPTTLTFPLPITVTVANSTFGTAIPSDFTIGLTGTPFHGLEIDPSGPTVVAIPAGTNYAVTVSGPSGYAQTSSSSCSGISASGLAPCAIKLDETPLTCDDRLWAPTYRRDRLKVLDACRAASGMVVDVGLEPDGDLVMEIVPDKAYTALLRPGNLSDPDAHGHLVVEVPCQTPPREAEASAACSGFSGDKIDPPTHGMHIAAAAHWVEDKNHSSWGELHGARIRVLPH